MTEEWRTIKDFPQYMVSNLGRVKSLSREARGAVKYEIKEKILKQAVNNKGYMWVNLYDGAKKKSYYVHRLVAEAFIPNPENKPNIGHIDTNPIQSAISMFCRGERKPKDKTIWRYKDEIDSNK